MDKKRLFRSYPAEELKGFEEFIESQPDDSNFLSQGNNHKKESSFENFTFLENDSNRLKKLKDLVMDKIPFAMKFEQGEELFKQQQDEIDLLKKDLVEVCNKADSPYRESLREIFDSFFAPPKN